MHDLRFSARPRAFAQNETARRFAHFAFAVLGNERSTRFCVERSIPLTRGNPVNRAAGEATNAAGGFLVPPEFVAEIFALRDKYGVFRRFASIEPMARDTKLAPRRTSGMTMSFTAEGVAATESTLGFDGVQLTTKKVSGLVKCSTELEEDSAADVGNYLAQEVAFACAKVEDDCGFNGDGTSTYGGMRGLTKLAIDGSHDAGKVVATTGHNLLTEIDATDLGALVAAAPSYTLENAKWFCSPFAFGNVFCRLAAAGAGGGIVPMTIDGVTIPTFQGFPIVTAPSLPNTSADLLGKAMLHFGDLSLASTVGNRRELRLQRSEHRYMETDQVAFLASHRFDIVNHDVGDNSTAGPIVTLVGG